MIKNKKAVSKSENPIEMNAVQSPLALDLARETRTAVAPAEFMSDTMRRERGLAEIQAFLKKREATGMEKMIIATLKINAPSEVIETMKTTAGLQMYALLNYGNKHRKHNNKTH